MARLTAKQERFVNEYLIDLNAEQAAARAGYAEDYGRQLLRLPHVSSAINTRLAEEKVAAKVRQEEAQVTRQWVLDRLRENVERAMQAEPVRDREGKETGEYTYQGSVANRSLELLGKNLGMFVDRVEHSGALTMTHEEKVQWVNELMQTAAMRAGKVIES